MSMSLGEKMKPVLEARLAALKAEVTEIDQTLREPDSQDFEERATENEGDEVLEDLGNAALTEIAQIETALGRIADGTYGECATCGADIAPARLEAVPHAAQCIKCAS
jgi:RNA polymerase-binding transcription factor DksA